MERTRNGWNPHSGFALIELVVAAVVIGIIALVLVFAAGRSVATGRQKAVQVLAEQISSTVLAWALEVRPTQTEAVSVWGSDCRYPGPKKVVSPLSGGVYQVVVPTWVEGCSITFLGDPVSSVRVVVTYNGKTYSAVH